MTKGRVDESLSPPGPVEKRRVRGHDARYFPKTRESAGNQILSRAVRWVERPGLEHNWTPTYASFKADSYPLPLGIQVTVIGSPDDFLLALRDTMLTRPAVLDEYNECKRRAAALGPDAYWEAKDRFLRALRATEDE